VNGGTCKYIEAFLKEPSASSDMIRSQKLLKEAMRLQQTLLKRGLDVFSRLKDPSLDPLFSRLQGMNVRPLTFLLTALLVSALYSKMVASTHSILY
jgi:hypothetical protein